jgi:acyl dehydratase
MVGGPYFEDFEVGQRFGAPGLTLTEGHAAMHQALTGDRLALALDAELSSEVTGVDRPLVHPNLVCDVAIGQSTGPTQRVLGNLFYRGLVLLRPVFVGDTLRTHTEIVGLKQNKKKGDNATGLVALRMSTVNQHGEDVLDFFRCPMIPLRDAEAETGHADGFDHISAELDPDRVLAAVPAGWDLDPLRAALPEGESAAELVPGGAYEVEGRDTVTAAPELARLTLNVARAHTDATGSPHGRRLVYGGHTISIAAAHVARALPGLATIVAWRSCDHLGPVFEGDVLGTKLEIEDSQGLEGSSGRLVGVRATVDAQREGDEEPKPVLDWRLLVLTA